MSLLQSPHVIKPGRRIYSAALAHTFLNIANDVTPHAGLYCKKESDDVFAVLEVLDSTLAVLWKVQQGDGYHGCNVTQLVTYDRVRQENYDSKTGSWNTTNSINHYATAIGATITKTFTGTSITFRHFTDNRGAIWEFVVDGDTANPVQIDTYSADPTQGVMSQLFSGLTNSEHTVVGTLVGVNPANVSGQTRGWASFHTSADTTTATFHAFAPDLPPSVTGVVMSARTGGITEIAFSSRPNDTPAYGYKWFPAHGTVSTVATTLERRRDGGLIAANDAGFVVCDEATVTAAYDVWHPDDVKSPELRMATMAVTHSFSSKGLAATVRVDYLKDTALFVAYTAMHTSASTQWVTHSMDTERNELNYDAFPADAIWSPGGKGLGAVFFAKSGTEIARRLLWAWGYDPHFVGDATTHHARDRTVYPKLYNRVYQNTVRPAGASEHYVARYKLGLAPAGKTAVELLPTPHQLLS